MPVECANPLFLAWVKEWYDVANERRVKQASAYHKAYKSLRACPITFPHPAQLQQLNGFGPKICERLADRLRKHCEQNGLPMPEHPRARRSPAGDDADDDDGGGGGGGDGDGNGENSAGEKPVVVPKKKARKPKAYVPKFRHGTYALVLALSTLHEEATTGLTKTELIELAQPHCDSSFTVPSGPGSYNTAWTHMKVLVKNEIVVERGRPLRRYMLTDDGWETARRIRETEHYKDGAAGPCAGEAGDEGSEDAAASRAPRSESAGPGAAPGAFADVVADGPSVEGDQSLPTFAPIRLPPGSFTVQLLLDVREIRSRNDRDYMQEELTKQGVKPVMRSLELGDAQWIAKVTDPAVLARHGAEGDEVVLDWIVERKRLDDLVSSIKDGRFREQKFRLRRSAATRVVYVIEDYAVDAAHAKRYEEAVQSAIASTQVVNGYVVKRTQTMDDTVRYLARMTAMLGRFYESKTLHVVPTRVLTAQNYHPLLRHLRERGCEAGVAGCYVTYPAFSSMASKSDAMTLRDVFLKMLMTTRGITGERALEIQSRWKTPRAFVGALAACGEGEAGRKRKREMLAGELSGMVGRRKFARAVTDRVAEVWGDA